MLIPKNLFASMEAAQKLQNNSNIQRIRLAMNNPAIQRLQQMMNSYPRLNEIREKINHNNLNIPIKQIEFLNIYGQIQVINLQLQTLRTNLGIYSENLEYWNTYINSVIDTYNHTQEEKFEVLVNEIPVIIIKSKLEEYIEAFKSLKLPIPKDLVIKLAISYYIFALLLFVFTTIPELKPAGESFAAWIFKTGGLTFQKYFIKIVALSDENNVSDLLSEGLFDLTKLFLFYLFKKGYDKTFKKNSK